MTILVLVFFFFFFSGTLWMKNERMRREREKKVVMFSCWWSFCFNCCKTNDISSKYNVTCHWSQWLELLAAATCLCWSCVESNQVLICSKIQLSCLRSQINLHFLSMSHPIQGSLLSSRVDYLVVFKSPHLCKWKKFV